MAKPLAVDMTLGSSSLAGKLTAAHDAVDPTRTLTNFVTNTVPVGTGGTIGEDNQTVVTAASPHNYAWGSPGQFSTSESYNTGGTSGWFAAQFIFRRTTALTSGDYLGGMYRGVGSNLPEWGPSWRWLSLRWAQDSGDEVSITHTDPGLNTWSELFVVYDWSGATMQAWQDGVSLGTASSISTLGSSVSSTFSVYRNFGVPKGIEFSAVRFYQNGSTAPTSTEIIAANSDQYEVVGDSGVTPVVASATATNTATGSATATIVVPSAVVASATAAGSLTGSATATVDTPATVTGEAAASSTSTGSATASVDTPATVDADASGAGTSSGSATATVDTPAEVTGDASASGTATGSATATVGSAATVDSDAAADGLSTGSATATVETPATVSAEAAAAALSAATATATVVSPGGVTGEASAAGTSSGSATAAVITPPFVDAGATASASSSGAATATVTSAGEVIASASASASSSGSATATVETPAAADGEATASSSSSGSATGETDNPPIDASASAGGTSSGSATASVITPAQVDASAAAVGIAVATARGSLLGQAEDIEGEGYDMGSLLNRERILDHVQWALSRISRANGYALDLAPDPDTGRPSVYRFMRSYDDVRPEHMPALCAFPATEQRAPAYLVAGQRDEFLRISIIGHVADWGHAERSLYLAQLEAAVFDSLGEDPTLGGWALHFVRSEGTPSDEGTPEREALTDGTATFLSAIEVTFTPGLSNRRPMRYGSIYVATGDDTTLTPGTFARPAATWASAITEPANVETNAAGRLTYLKPRPLDFRVHAALELVLPSAGTLSLRLNVNGTALERSLLRRDNTAGERVLVVLEDFVNLEPQHYVEVEIAHSVGQIVTLAGGKLQLAPLSLV